MLPALSGSPTKSVGAPLITDFPEISDDRKSVTFTYSKPFADWEAEFALYRDSPQYRNLNAGMSLAEFQRIYWWEWGHRQLGRLIGAVWAIGFLWFLLRRRIPAGHSGPAM